MTHTTTDAAEARARREAVALIAELIAKESSRKFYGINGVLTNKLATISLTLERPFATAEAASGAGEREADALREALYRAAVDLLYTPRHNRDGAADQHIRESRERIRQSLYPSLPPATDPAMALELAKARKSIEILRRALAWHGDRQRMATTREHWQQEIDAAIQWVNENPEPDYPSFSTLAALAAAPTIPATGEAIPAGMKPWHGGDAAPNDLDLSGRVLREDGQTEVGRDVTIQQWKRPVPRCKWNIIAYTPKATIPATGHAATEPRWSKRHIATVFFTKLRQSQKDEAAKAMGMTLDYSLPSLECGKAFLRAVEDQGKWGELQTLLSAMLPADASGHAATEGEGA